MLGKDSVVTSLRTAVDPHLHQREKNGIRILDLHGPLTSGDSESRLRTAIIAMTETRAVNVILNFARVEEIDADGLGALVFCYAHMVHSGGALKLLNPRPLHLSLLLRTKLNTMFEVFADERDAVNSFSRDRVA